MKTILYSTLILLSTLSFGQRTANSEAQTQTTRNIPTFQAIKSEGPFYITVTDAPQNGKIYLEGTQRQLDRIITEVNSEGVLVIKFKPREKVKKSKRKTKTVNKNSASNRINITVSAQNLTSAKLSGSGDLILNGTQNVDTFETSVSGSGDIKAKVKANKTIVTISGSGDIKVTGTTKDLEAKLSGSGDIEAQELQATNAKVTVNGSGDIKVWTTNELNGQIIGSGDIHYKGTPKTLNRKSVGSGSFRSL